MRKLFASSTFAVASLAVSIVAWSATSSSAARSQDELQRIGAKLAADLSRACPHAANLDTAAFQKCTATLAQARDIPFTPGVIWGGDQPNLRIKKRHLTHFSADVFRTNYLPLMTFTGEFSVARDEKENVDIIKIEAYFRNALPAGEYPYPFWHTSAKWDAYEVMNRLNFYLDDKGRIFLITRAADGSDKNKGQYNRVAAPVFVKDQWTWLDAKGQQQPRVMLFSSRYQAANPQMKRLDESYRAFALTMREASCLSCHNPSNPPGSERLYLLQTPLHAAGEIENVIKSVRAGDMPQDERGQPADIDPKLRASMLRSAEAFRAELIAADAWEASRKVSTTPAPAAAQRAPAR